MKKKKVNIKIKEVTVTPEFIIGEEVYVVNEIFAIEKRKVTGYRLTEQGKDLKLVYLFSWDYAYEGKLFHTYDDALVYAHELARKTVEENNKRTGGSFF